MLRRKDCAKCGVNQADKPLIALPMIFLCDDCYSKQESLEERIKELKADLKIKQSVCETIEKEVTAINEKLKAQIEKLVDGQKAKTEAGS